FECLAIETSAVACRATHRQVGQEVHFDAANPLALTLFAAAALDVEAEAAELVAAELGLARAGKYAANVVKHARVRGGIAARRAADRRLIDFDQLVELAGATQTAERAGLRAFARQSATQRTSKRFID